MTSRCLVSDKTHLLVFDISLLGVWISYETVFLVCHVLHLLSSLAIEEIKKIIVFFHLNCYGYEQQLFSKIAIFCFELTKLRLAFFLQLNDKLPVVLVK